MSAVVIAGFAAVCVGVIWYERWQVRRSAVRRGMARRAQQPWRDWTYLPPPSDPLTRNLASTLEHAVIAADVAWSYRDLYHRTRGMHESPFELRRGRMEASALRFEASLRRVVQTARRCVETSESMSGVHHDIHRRDVVARLLDFVECRQNIDVPRDTLVGIERDIDVLESTLAHIVDTRQRPVPEDPFRW